MNYNSVILNQGAGLGDLIYIQSIAMDFIKRGVGCSIVATDIYMPIEKHFPHVTFIDKSNFPREYDDNQERIVNDVRIIPMRFSDSLCQVPYRDCMKSKYMLVGMDWTKWKDDCVIERDKEAEDRLFYDVLGLSDGEIYTVVSENYHTGGRKQRQIEVKAERIVKVEFIEGFTHIDWLKVYQNATEIHAVSSSNIYLFELFEIKCPIHLYVRKPMEKNHANYEYLLMKSNYIFHD